ncbi:nuclear pore complex protein Nup214-like protein [Lates japonicus]|uniref:Nuclear pore complex protein Nup214 n=1 Tax=Lates japonicus TaxID=270547 RepID=A0AAD3RJZ2_LATJO|nr:nuclear pore complex protein Nup214-like protein [Lates japonicus]
MSDDTDTPPEREMKDFQFRQMKKARVFEAPEDLPKERSSLLTISNKFGLTFVGLDRTFKVYRTQDILAADKADGNSNEIVSGIAAVAEVTVELALHHLALSCDELTLSVCGMSEGGGLSLTFYDVRTFMNKARLQKLPFASVQAAAPSGTSVQDLKWNPTQASTLAACLSDGSMMILDVTDSVKMQAQLPASSGITCICWSPKGKQVAAGKMDATVTQYTPSLEAKKDIPCPHFYTSSSVEPVKALDVLWLKTFVFAVVYAAADGSLETPPELVLISLPKKDENVETKCLNFGDLVYGSCTERLHHYFLSHVEDWDLVFAASAASIEVSVIAKQDEKIWELWILEDASRAELPVTETSDDTLPLGLAIDYTNQQEIHISDEKTLPPVPTMLMLSTEGLLCPFALLNLNPGVKQLVSPPSALPLEGERLPKPGSLATQPPKSLDPHPLTRSWRRKNHSQNWFCLSYPQQCPPPATPQSGCSQYFLTESTLKTVPQVVNVQELKDKGFSCFNIISSVSKAPAKVSSFTSASTGFSFASVTQGTGMSQVKDVNKFSFGGNGKMVFGQTGEEAFSLTPKSTSPALGTASPTLPANPSGEAAKPTSTTAALRIEPQPPKTIGGETLGSFSGLRVGQGEEAKDSSTKSTPASFTFGDTGLGMGKGAAQFSFGAGLQKSAEESTGADLSKGVVSGSLFKPPESNNKPAFSVPQSGPTASGLPTSFSSLLTASSDSSQDPKAPPQPSEPTPPPEKEPASEATVESSSPPVVPDSAGDAATIAAKPTPAAPAAAPPSAAPVPTPDPASTITAPPEATPPAPPSGFGQPASNTGTSSGFSFGQPAFGANSSSATTGGGGGLFGASTASNASSFSFGTSSANTASSTGSGLFGQSTAPAFGQNSGFGQGSVFGSNTTTSSSSGFSFGQPSGFGCSSATPVFGQQSNSGSVFGQQQPSSGGGLFGSSSANTAGSAAGGGFFSGLGGKPTEEAANKNPFGTAASTGGFGQSAQTGANSLFGNSGAKTFGFGQSGFGEQKPSGTFSTGGGSVASQGFGSFSTPTKPGGFGEAPVFGSPLSSVVPLAFGGAASFAQPFIQLGNMGSPAGKAFERNSSKQHGRICKKLICSSN